MWRATYSDDQAMGQRRDRGDQAMGQRRDRGEQAMDKDEQAVGGMVAMENTDGHGQPWAAMGRLTLSMRTVA